MGHTHYWTINSQIPQNEWDVFITDAQKILGVLGVPLTGNENEPDDRQPVLNSEMVYFNGVDDGQYETFCISPEPNRNYCKTNQHPYDEPVMAALTLAKHHFGSRVEVTSDGTPSEWEQTIRKVRSAFGYGDFPFSEESLRESWTPQYAERHIADLHRFRADMGIARSQSVS